MKAMAKNGRCVAAVVLIGMVLGVVALAAPRSGRSEHGGLWLSHCVGNQVTVTFTVAPPDMARTVTAKLMDAETPGIVLKLGKDEIFFSYANIICVEPAGT